MPEEEHLLKYPSLLLQDYHLVAGQPEIISNFHKEFNKDESARATPWEPPTFSGAADATKHRMNYFETQIKAPAWLLKVIGGCPIIPCQTFRISVRSEDVKSTAAVLLIR